MLSLIESALMGVGVVDLLMLLLGFARGLELVDELSLEERVLSEALLLLEPFLSCLGPVLRDDACLSVELP